MTTHLKDLDIIGKFAAGPTPLFATATQFYHAGVAQALIQRLESSTALQG